MGVGLLEDAGLPLAVPSAARALRFMGVFLLLLFYLIYFAIRDPASLCIAALKETSVLGVLPPEIARGWEQLGFSGSGVGRAGCAFAGAVRAVRERARFPARFPAAAVASPAVNGHEPCAGGSGEQSCGRVVPDRVGGGCPGRGPTRSHPELGTVAGAWEGPRCTFPQAFAWLLAETVHVVHHPARCGVT